jgi:DNA excision repair protein ERCC-3
MFLEKTGRVFVDVHDSRYAMFQDFLVTCADPVSRTSNINEYRITPSSLACATADGVYSMDRVREILIEHAVTSSSADRNDRSKKLPSAVEEMISHEERSDRLRLVLSPRISKEAASGEEGESSELTNLGYFLVSSSREHLAAVVPSVREWLEPVIVRGALTYIFSERETATVSKNLTGPAPVVFRAALRHGTLRAVREALLKHTRVAVDLYYDYRADTFSHKVANFALKDTVKLRPYQCTSLERFQRNGVAHHGIVVLPCGAGKTLTGIAAAQIIGKRTAIMCINHQSALQWRRELLNYTTLEPSQVTMCLSDAKEMPGDVFITTYSMLTVTRREQLLQDGSVSENAQLTEKILEAISRSAWGLLVLDEVHQATAEQFQKCVEKVPHHCVLGLSATLLREDGHIEDLRYLVGPKLYEANWLELARAGYLATVNCAEVRCPTPATFLRAYLSPELRQGVGASHRLLPLECLNPNKILATQALLQFHQAKSPPDKTLVFCDSVACGRYYARKLGLPFMDGSTKEKERGNLLGWFRATREVNALVLSRVGDVALDLPEASVIIQISGLGASRRQEAQRLGRILRMKPPTVDSSGYFYSLVADDTDEVLRAAWRQEWLREQGFSYRILPLATVLNASARLRAAAAADSSSSLLSSRLGRSLIHPICVAPARWSYRNAEGEGQWVELPPSQLLHQAEASFFRGFDVQFPGAHHTDRNGFTFAFSASVSEDGCIGTVKVGGNSESVHPLYCRPPPTHRCGEECEHELMRAALKRPRPAEGGAKPPASRHRRTQ